MTNLSWQWMAVASALSMLVACGDDTKETTGNKQNDQKRDTGTSEDTTSPEDTGESMDTSTPADTVPEEDTDMSASDTRDGGEMTDTRDGGERADTPSMDGGESSDTMSMDSGEPPATEVVDCSNVTVDETVQVVDFRFQPPQVEVSQGGVVQWEFQSSGHSVTDNSDCNNPNPNDNFDSQSSEGLGGLSESGDTFCVRFNDTPDDQNGYPYQCVPHCSSENMIGVVTVVQ